MLDIGKRYNIADVMFTMFRKCKNRLTLVAGNEIEKSKLSLRLNNM